MTEGSLIPFRRNPHTEAQRLLPWYVADRLDAADHAQVDAHLITCSACREDLAVERRLRKAVSDLAPEIERGWGRLRDRIARPAPGARAGRWATAPPAWVGWALTAQFAACAVAAVMLFAFVDRRPAAFHTLSAAAPRPVGDAMVVFRPNVREADMRRALELAGARIVDGPTAAGAYVLRAPAGGADRALATLRAQTAVEAAQPIDSGR